MASRKKLAAGSGVLRVAPAHAVANAARWAAAHSAAVDHAPVPLTWSTVVGTASGGSATSATCNAHSTHTTKVSAAPASARQHRKYGQQHGWQHSVGLDLLGRLPMTGRAPRVSPRQNYVSTSNDQNVYNHFEITNSPGAARAERDRPHAPRRTARRLHGRTGVQPGPAKPHGTDGHPARARRARQTVNYTWPTNG